jgi:hypothetical protein
MKGMSKSSVVGHDGEWVLQEDPLFINKHISMLQDHSAALSMRSVVMPCLNSAPTKKAVHRCALTFSEPLSAQKEMKNG